MTTLTKGEQFIFDWQYKRHGSTSFKGYLSKALAVADNSNLTKLRLAFPEEARAMNLFHSQTGWWEMVEDKARKSEPFTVYSVKRSPQNNVATTGE